MSETIQVRIPDIGDFKDIPVIEVLVRPGDAIKKEDPLVTLESDKATMEVPSPADGTVKELKIKIGDKVSEGSVVLLLDSAHAAGSTQAPAAQVPPTGTRHATASPLPQLERAAQRTSPRPHRRFTPAARAASRTACATHRTYLP